MPIRSKIRGPQLCQSKNCLESILFYFKEKAWVLKTHRFSMVSEVNRPELLKNSKTLHWKLEEVVFESRGCPGSIIALGILSNRIHKRLDDLDGS